ncbi:trigger factor-like [Planococcus citri]|uniref:trigger factor-like n=1 Tax=Planococcus citri TaxID=170843 RepID=UPI0031F7574F
MISIAFITLLSVIFSNSLATDESVTEKVPAPQSDQNDWFANLPTFGWLYNQQAPKPSEVESNPKDESHSIKPDLTVVQNDEPKIEVDENYSPDEHEPVKKVDDILKMIEVSSNEEKEKCLPFLEKFENTLTHEPARYAKILYKNMQHIVDMGLFNSSQRKREAEKVKSFYEKLIDFLKGIWDAIYNFFAGRIEAGKRGAQMGWAEYERRKEKDLRTYSEEDALKKLEHLEKEYKTMNKEELIKDTTSLCMQALYTVNTYERIVRFLEVLKKEEIVDKHKLDKAFDYVDYKGDFARKHNIQEIKKDEKHEKEHGHEHEHVHEHVEHVEAPKAGEEHKKD